MNVNAKKAAIGIFAVLAFVQSLAQQISCEKIGFNKAGYLSESLGSINGETSWEKWVWKELEQPTAYPNANNDDGSDGNYCDDGNYNNINCSPFMFFNGSTSNAFSEDPRVQVELGNDKSPESYIRIGNPDPSVTREQLKYSFEVTEENHILMYKYFVVFDVPISDINEPDEIQDEVHTHSEIPFFKAFILDTNNDTINKNCSLVDLRGQQGREDVFDYVYKKINPESSHPYDRIYAHSGTWQTKLVNLDNYIGKTVTFVFETGDCVKADHFGYAYVDAKCISVLNLNSPNCAFQNISLSSNLSQYVNNINRERWFTPNGSFKNNPDRVLYKSVGEKDIYYSGTYRDGGHTCAIVIKKKILIEECEPLISNCCVGSFAPDPGKKYLISAWCSENVTAPVELYQGAAIAITYQIGEAPDLEEIEEILYPKGLIVDGWQKIEQETTIPSQAKNIEIELLNLGVNDVFYDDIRFQPFNSNMKTFVYDPLTKKLIAQHDENNFATFYEYDEEGKLLRIKKESERGIKTISEGRNNLLKQ
jgi:hypothetical protein